MLNYRGYRGRAGYDDESRILHGEVLDLRDVVTFQAKSADELHVAFRASIDDYLEYCEERGDEPNRTSRFPDGPGLADNHGDRRR